MSGSEIERRESDQKSLRLVAMKNRLHRENDEDESPRSTALEPHFTVTEIAKRWGMSEKSVRRFFADEPGVLKSGSPETHKKRGYCNLRIPESVLIRVHQRRAS